MQRLQGFSWRNLAQGSVNRKIFSAAVVVAGLGLGVKLVTVIKDVMVASAFGAGAQIDSFLIALLLPNFVISVVARSFNVALVPTYIHVREQEGREAAQRLFSNVVVLSSAILAVVSVILAVAGPFLLPLLGSGFTPDQQHVTLEMFYLLLPSIILNGLATIWSAVLNAGERFALSSWATVTIPVGTMIALLAFGPLWGVYTLSIGMVIGSVFQALLLGWGLQRQGLRWWPRWSGISPELRHVLTQYTPLVAGGILQSSTLLTDQAVAATLDPGSVAALGYGDKITTLVLSLAGVAIRTAILPYFSRQVAAQNWKGLRHSARTYTQLIFAIGAPIAIVLFILAEPLVRILFERGAFTAEQSHLVGQVQAMYALNIPFFVFGTLITPLISALRANRILMWGTIITMPLNVALDLLLAHFFGVAGVALGTALVTALACGFLTIGAYRVIGRYERGELQLKDPLKAASRVKPTIDAED